MMKKMGRTIPSFRVASTSEESDWNRLFVKYLEKKDKHVFRNMYSTSILYNSACSYCANPQILYPILYSLAFHQYKSLKIEKRKNKIIKNENQTNGKKIGKEDEIHYKNTNTTTAANILFPYENIVTKEIESWRGYAECLGKEDRILFYKMLKECYKYSIAINAMGQGRSTSSILMSVLFEIYKMKEKNKIQMD